MGRKIYFLFIVLTMFNSMKMNLLWSFPVGVVEFLAAVSTLFVSMVYRIVEFKKYYVLLLVLLVFIHLFELISSPSFNLTVLVMKFSNIITIFGVICLKEIYKCELLEFLIKVLSCVLIISMPAWILYLIGFSFPSSPWIDMGDGFHVVKDYTFFVVSDIAEFSSAQRFSSLFLEPGWIGTMSVLLLIGRGFTYKSISFYLFLAAIILSMSLSAIVNLVICFFLWVLLTSKHRVLLITLFSGSLVGVILFGMNYNKGDNALNELVIQRLVFDEDLGIAGNNRTNDQFDYEWELFLRGPNRMTGMRLSPEEAETESWYNSSSGIRKEILSHGFIGTALFAIFLICIYRRYYGKNGFVFLTCFMLATIVRAMWRFDFYVITFIISLSYLYNLESKCGIYERKKNSCLCQSH